jgi:hypothetical protein
MSSTNSKQVLWRVLGRILILLIVALCLIQSGNLVNFADLYGFLLILVGGVALVMTGFPGAEIALALRHAAGASGTDVEIKSSIHFWEAAARSFWILGVAYSVLILMIGFTAMATQPDSMELMMNSMARSLLATLYGVLLSVFSFIPCWKLMGKLQGRPPVPGAEQGLISSPHSGWGFGTVIGYILFFSVLASFLIVTIQKLSMPGLLWMGYRPAMLFVLGGALALMLFMGRSDTGPTPSTAFAGMGLIASLMGCIQMFFAMPVKAPHGIAQVAGALAFILSSCLTALLGIAIVSAPLEDRALRTGRVSAPSIFSRVSWYVFPLLALMFLALVFVVLTLPLSNPH